MLVSMTCEYDAWSMTAVNLCADDIPLQRHATYPIIIPVGPFWDELEAWWSDLVNELPEIPFDGNRYFDSHLKPSLGDHSISLLTQNLRHGIICA